MNDMKWIEQIRVRSSKSKLHEAMPSLQNQVKDIEASSNGAETFFMKHALYDGDLAIVLVWMNNVEPQHTREGLLVAERLQELGPIDHAVWVPADNSVMDRP